jgi:hypothetical protein
MLSVPLLCFSSRIAAKGVLPSLPKIVGPGLATGPNIVGSGCQVRLKTLLKRAISVDSCCSAGLNSVGSRLARPKILQRGVGFGCLARPTDLGPGWAVGPNILGSGSATIPNDIIIYIKNILNFIIINIKIITICIINIIIIIIKSINIKNSIICIIIIFIFL